MKLVVENKRYDEALFIIKQYLDKRRNENILKGNLNVAVTLNDTGDALSDNDVSEMYITDEHGNYMNESEKVAVQLSLEMWNDYTKHLRNNIKFIKKQILKDEDYLNMAEQNNRKCEYISKRKESVDNNRKKLKPLLIEDDVANKITKRIANSEYEVIFEQYDESGYSDKFKMAVLIFRNIIGEDYYFKCSGGYYGSPYCEGMLSKGLPINMSK